jgi:ArsR family transcriptional regulator, arsenate/arsenite/antimonite-responsive transcriptional repressor
MATAPVSRHLASDDELVRLARLFHALSDETRLRIVGRLLAGEQCVCNLTDALDAGQSRLSFHIKTLKEAGLVTDRRDGRWIHYSLNHEALSGIGSLLGSLAEKAETVCGRKCCG